MPSVVVAFSVRVAVIQTKVKFVKPEETIIICPNIHHDLDPVLRLTCQSVMLPKLQSDADDVL